MNDHYDIVGSRARALVTGGLLAALLVAGCGANVEPSSGPSTAPVAVGPTAATGPGSWASADVVQPDVVTQAPSLEPGYHCSPCHPAAASQLFGIAPAGDGFVAVGVQQPPAEAILLRSHDGVRWEPDAAWTPAEGTAAIAVASDGSRTVVVGSGHAGAAAWAGSDGTWTAADPAGLGGSPGATAMTAVVAHDGGFVGVGYRDDPANAAASAAVWRSTDGLSWRADAASPAFAGGRMWSVAARGDTLVAVGTDGDPTYGPAAAWVSTDGTWRRAEVASPDGVMRAVTSTADGFVAVGYATTDDGARVWRSADGTTWSPVDDQASLDNHSSPIRMLSVAADERGLVAGGWRADAANGSSAAWTSPDGVHWTAAPWVPAFSGGQIPGVAVAGDLALGVGRSGYPDNNQAAAWVSRRP